MRICLLGAAAALAVGCGAQMDNRSEARSNEFRDTTVGISGSVPKGWHRSGPLTKFRDPREAVVLASYSLRANDEAGECAPRKALADLPPDGAFVWLLEYRPARGAVWADMPRTRFRPKPARFGLDRVDLKPGISCHDGPGYRTTFRAADRPFDLFVAFGERAPDSRIAEVDALLDSLRFDELPPPPPDPYAGWPLLTDASGDSFRPPPRWPGAAVDFRPGKTPRPRLLFFASNRGLWGLPKKLVPRIDELRGDDIVPTGALANDFPPDGVVVFVIEEPQEGPDEWEDEFRPIGRDWPARSDFVPAEMATEPAPDLKWRRAQGTYSGYHFGVWIGSLPDASDRDLDLAFKSAASLAVSDCWRDDFDPDCPEG